MKRIFVAGTDTDVGKTLVARLLMTSMLGAGYEVSALKPVAAGSSRIGSQLCNEDAALLAALCSKNLPVDEVNPCLVDQPVAPHIAAAQQGVELSVADCTQRCEPVLAGSADVCVIEGAGGWLVPLNARETMADLALALQADIVLVVGMRLGCINHALLSAESIRASGARLAGWVANCINPDMPCLEDNILALNERLDAPLLARIPALPVTAAGEALPGSIFDTAAIKQLIEK